jgi:hypothetical protein
MNRDVKNIISKYKKTECSTCTNTGEKENMYECDCCDDIFCDECIHLKNVSICYRCDYKECEDCRDKNDGKEYEDYDDNTWLDCSGCYKTICRHCLQEGYFFKQEEYDEPFFYCKECMFSTINYFLKSKGIKNFKVKN